MCMHMGRRRFPPGLLVNSLVCLCISQHCAKELHCSAAVTAARFYLLHPSATCYTHTHTRLTDFFPGVPGWAGTRKVKPVWILLKQETVSGSGISWAICKSAPGSRQITMPAPHHSVFYRPDALPATQPTASKHWRQHVTAYIYVLSCLVHGAA